MKQKGWIRKYLAAVLVFLLAAGYMSPVRQSAAAAGGAPGKPMLSHNQWGEDTDGEYDISCNMWYGNNATSYKLYERIGIKGEFETAAEGTLADNSPNAQSVTISITGRTIPGTYYYQMEFTNAYGSTLSDTITVQVGAVDLSKIILDTVDDNGTALQYTIPQGVTEIKLINVDSASPLYSVISSNTDAVRASIRNGDILRLEALAAGRSGLQIRDAASNEMRQIGIRVKNADGTNPGLPEYLSLGQVSEDTANDLNFWKGIGDGDTNKRCDIRYIYINGGPTSGWRSWTTVDGDRAVKYIKESLKMGMIPYFVFYNIPDGSEDYSVDLRHINDTAYMEGYYQDLKFLLDLCNQYAGDETVGMVLEPDFLGYMMQQSGKRPAQIAAAGVTAAYTSGVLEEGKDPSFANTVTGLVESINYIISKYGSHVTFGWQFNTWGYSGVGTPGQGLMHATETMGYETGRSFIETAARETAAYYREAGILSNGADFISIDKYGLDGAYEAGAAANPAGSRWLWNADIWNNYLFYTKTLHEETQLPVTLWQIPVGHLNGSLEENPYSGGIFPDLNNTAGYYEDSAPDFFFGDSFKPGSQARMEYFSSNGSKDPKITVNGDTITYGSHMEEAKAAGITTILFGAGVGASTDAVGDPPSDGYWWITKAQRYLQNPVSLK